MLIIIVFYKKRLHKSFFILYVITYDNFTVLRYESFSLIHCILNWCLQEFARVLWTFWLTIKGLILHKSLNMLAPLSTTTKSQSKRLRVYWVKSTDLSPCKTVPSANLHIPLLQTEIFYKTLSILLDGETKNEDTTYLKNKSIIPKKNINKLDIKNTNLTNIYCSSYDDMEWI